MYDLSAIKHYILYLKQQEHLAITLHPIKYEGVFTTGDLMPFNIHENSYCIYLKTCRQAQEHCIAKQSSVLKKAESGPYCGTCHAGVREFVYPFSDGDKTVGFVSVSGYRDPLGEEYLRAVSRKYSLPVQKLRDNYRYLKSDLPPKEWVDTLILPLCQMLELAYRKTAGAGKELTFPEQIVAYLKQVHNSPVSSADICRHFSCSRSYMSSRFNAHTGMSIREYINRLRIADAKSLLRYSDLSVTEIALSVGFTDSNYFSGIFKQYESLSPMQYRKKAAL